MKHIFMILILILLLTVPVYGWENSMRYTIVKVKNSAVHTNCVKDPRIVPGAEITLYKHGTPKWVGKVEGAAGGGRLCKQFRLNETNLVDGLYLSVWNWHRQDVPQDQKRKLTASERKSQIQNIHHIVSQDPNFKRRFRLRSALGFIHRDKIMGIAQYAYENPATEETEIAIYRVEIAPVPMIRRVDFFSGTQSEIPVDFTFDIITDNRKSDTELVILSGAPIADSDAYIGELRILRGDENGDFTTYKTQNFLF